MVGNRLSWADSDLPKPPRRRTQPTARTSQAAGTAGSPEASLERAALPARMKDETTGDPYAGPMCDMRQLLQTGTSRRSIRRAKPGRGVYVPAQRRDSAPCRTGLGGVPRGSAKPLNPRAVHRPAAQAAAHLAGFSGTFRVPLPLFVSRSSAPGGRCRRPWRRCRTSRGRAAPGGRACGGRGGCACRACARGSAARSRPAP